MLEQLDCALPLNVAIEAVADFIANTADMTDDERKTAAIVLRMVAQKWEAPASRRCNLGFSTENDVPPYLRRMPSGYTVASKWRGKHAEKSVPEIPNISL